MSALACLSGRRVVVTRQREQAESFCRRLTELGAEPVRFPTIDFALVRSQEVDQALANLQAYDWILFTSPNAVRFFLDLLEEAQTVLTDPRIAATGSQTAATLRAAGYVCDFVPADFSGATLAATLPNVTGQRILVPRTEQGRPELSGGLLSRGAEVDDLAIYRTIFATPTSAEVDALRQGTDVLTFTSPLTLRNFFALVDQLSLDQAVAGAAIACIGPTTAAEAHCKGLKADIVADTYTTDGLLDALCAYYESKSRSAKESTRDVK